MAEELYEVASALINEHGWPAPEVFQWLHSGRYQGELESIAAGDTSAVEVAAFISYQEE